MDFGALILNYKYGLASAYVIRLREGLAKRPMKVAPRLFRPFVTERPFFILIQQVCSENDDAMYNRFPPFMGMIKT